MPNPPHEPEPPLWEQWAQSGVEPSEELREDGERLQKVLAQRGYGSRRACEELIAAGRVRVNGEVATLGDRIDPEVDLVEVDGQIGRAHV